VGVAETSKLLVELNLTGNFNSGIQSAEARVVGFGSAATGATAKAETFASRLSGGVGNALSTFKGRLEGAAKSVAVFAGIGGLLSIGGAVETSIHKLEDFGLALEKIQTLTGETAKDSGTLILLFERFGLSMDQVGTFAGFAEKTLGKLNETTAKGAKVAKSAELQNLELIKNERVAAGLSTKKIDLLIKEQKARDAVTAANTAAVAGQTKLQALDAKYGLSLVDSKGKVVNYTEELRQLADFYDRNHDAATRAYVASTLLGRGYAALAPILDQGSAAIRRAADEADQLGLGNEATAKKIADFRNTMRDLGVQVNVLELQIGMALMPVVSRFATRITDFVSGHGQEIAKFFGDLGTFAENTAGQLYDAAKTVAGFWNAIPQGFRDLLVTGIATDRTIKFLFGFDPIKLGAGLLGKGFDQFASRGSSPANPVFVAGVGLGGGGLSGGGGGLLGSIFKVAAAGAAVGAVGAFVIEQSKSPAAVAYNAMGGNGTRGFVGNGNSPILPTGLAGPTAPLNSSGSPTDRAEQRAALLKIDRSINTESSAVTRAIHAQIAAVQAAEKASEMNLQPLPAKISAAQRANFNTLRDRIEASRIATQTGTRAIGSRVDSESAAVTRAIHAQKLAVNLSLTNRTTISVADVNGAIHTHSIYSTGMRGALLGM
jgi:hypothetical protein